VLVGTPVGPGSIMDDVVRAARGKPGVLADRGEWVRARGFDPHVYPAIVDAGTDRERSAWPVPWPLHKLHALRDEGEPEFALQMMCDPDDPAARTGWTEHLFRYAEPASYDPGGTLWRIGSIDPSGTSGRASGVDHMAFVGVAVGRDGPDGRRVCVEEASAGSWDPEVELQAVIDAWARRFPRARKLLIVEGNGPGAWLSRLLRLPPGVELAEPYRSVQNKTYRHRGLLSEYRRCTVLHSGKLPQLEGQMVAWKPGASGPAVDDLIDAAAAAVFLARYGDAAWSPERVAR
jgi:hypothetical protein